MASRFEYKSNSDGKVCGIVNRNAERVVRRVISASQVAGALRLDSSDWTMPDPAGEMRIDAVDSKAIRSAAQARAAMVGKTDTRLDVAEDKPRAVSSAAQARRAMVARGGR